MLLSTRILSVAFKYLITWSDIYYAVNRVCEFLHAPQDTHWSIVKHILLYDYFTTYYGLHLRLAHSVALSAFSVASRLVVLMIGNPWEICSVLWS
jgi:hypothetical protein